MKTNAREPRVTEEVKKDIFVHPSSYIDAGATLGDGTRVWHFCHVMGGVTLGRRCSLGQNVFIAAGVDIGDNVKIQNNVSVYEGVTLEADVFCGPSVVFTNVRTPRSAFPRNSAEHYGRTLVARGASLGANSTIVCGVTIGAHAFVAAGAVVTRDVPPYALIVGVPGHPIGWVCECGPQLKFHGDEAECAHCSRQYVRTSAGIRRMEIHGDRQDTPAGSESRNRRAVA